MKKIIAIFVCILFLSVPGVVRADIAPPPAPHGGDILPGEGTETRVRMVSETVLVEALLHSDDQPSIAQVTASFQMRNLGNADESMLVRFPLDLVGGEVCEMVSKYPGLRDFKAWVNGQAVQVAFDRKAPGNGFPWDITDCWAKFQVTFPAGADIPIKVSYIQSAGPNEYTISGFSSYVYVLRTGAGWYGSIGNADISFHAPWELNSENLLERSQEKFSKVSGNEIHWHFEDFDPQDGSYDMRVVIMDPAVWHGIVAGRSETAANPQDGEAWGRLAKALKLATLERRGVYREDYFRESFAAYQKAVALKPWDADWHYGFAELLCSQAQLQTVYGEGITDDFERDCILQLKAALKINPAHGKAAQLLVELYKDASPELSAKYELAPYLEPALTAVQATSDQRGIFFSTTIAPFEATDAAKGSVSATPLPSNTPSPQLPSGTAPPNPRAASVTPSPLPSATPVRTATTAPTATPAPAAAGGACGAILLPILLGLAVLGRKVIQGGA